MADSVALLLLAAFLAAAFYAAHRGASGVSAAFGAYFAGWRPDPWPHGVQEEDRDRPWGTPDPARSAAPGPVLDADFVEVSSPPVGGVRMERLTTKVRAAR